MLLFNHDTCPDLISSDEGDCCNASDCHCHRMAVVTKVDSDLCGCYDPEAVAENRIYDPNTGLTACIVNVP